MRFVVVVLAALVLVPIALFFGVLAGLTLVQEVLATFIDLGNSSFTSWMNPAVLLGVQSPGGSGGILDALVGGPGAPGGTVGRFIVFGISGAIAYGVGMGILALWTWAAESSTESKGEAS